MSSRPIGAGAGEPSSAAAAAASSSSAASASSAPVTVKKTYRPPNTPELKDMIKMFNLRNPDDDTPLTTKDADRILVWLQKRPDLAVDWFYEKTKDGNIGLKDPRYLFNTHYNSILSQIFLAEQIPVDHPLIEELACRSPDFTIQDEDTESLLQTMEDRLEYWDPTGLSGESKWIYDNYMAKYELAKNPKALKERCNRKYMRQGVKNVRSLLLASKSGLPIPEGPKSVITGMLIGKQGSTEQQMTAAKQELFPNLYGSSSSSSSSSSASKGKGKGKGRRSRRSYKGGSRAGRKAATRKSHK